MSLLRKFFGVFTSDNMSQDMQHTLDHVVPGRESAEYTGTVYSAKLAEAQTRYGKPFITAEMVKRETPPSHLLEELNRRSDELKKKREDEDAAERTKVRRIGK